MKPIKNAITYKCDLPSVSALEDYLSTHAFREIGEVEAKLAGFIPVLDDRFVLPFPDGYAFKLRYDEKILPSSAINQETNKRVAMIEEARDVRLQRKEISIVRDEVLFEFTKKALSQSKQVTAYYRPTDRLLVVDTASKSLADVLSSNLVRAVGSIKATTIYISGISNGLTAKLKSHLDGGDGLEGFEIGGVCKLKGEEGKTLSVKVHDINESKYGLIEALEQGCKVIELEIGNQDVSFRLNEKFIKKGIFFKSEQDEYEAEDELDYFQHHASCQMLWLANACQQLLTLFEYKEPVAEAPGGAS